jgi:hypothetical protein
MPLAGCDLVPAGRAARLPAPMTSPRWSRALRPVKIGRDSYTRTKPGGPGVAE